MKEKCRDAVLMTGASSGIGKAPAREYQRRGFAVIASARRLSALSELEGRISCC